MAHTVRCGIAVVACAMLCAATPAVAQSEASIAYQFARLNVSGESANLPVGIAADYAYAVSSKIRLVGVVDWVHRADSGSLETFMETFTVEARTTQLTTGGGVRVESGSGPYAQAVVGVAHTSFRGTINGHLAFEPTSTDFMFAPGMGVAVPVATRLRLLGEIGFRLIRPHAQSDLFFNDSVHGFRALVGTRIRLH